MTDTYRSETLSNIQLLQDMLSEHFNIFLVLVDQNVQELTLPSQFPLSCYENALTDTHCKNCLSICLSKHQDGEDEPFLGRCHRGLFYTVFPANIRYLIPVYLIAGFSVEAECIAKTAPLLQAIFNLPIVLDSSFQQRPYKKTTSCPDNTLGLTQQELNILHYVVNGLPNQDIATKLYISLNTVKTHIAHIFSKLKVSNRTEASLFVHKNGLIEMLKR